MAILVFQKSYVSLAQNDSLSTQTSKTLIEINVFESVMNAEIN